MLFPSRYAKQNGLKDKILALATETMAQLWDIENRDCNPNSKSQIPAYFQSQNSEIERLPILGFLD